MSSAAAATGTPAAAAAAPPAAKPGSTPAPVAAGNGATAPDAKPGDAAKPDAKKEDERFSRSFAKLTQQQKAFEAERAKFAEDRKAAEADIAAAKAAKEAADLLAKDPAAWLEKFGGQDTYNRLTKWKLEGNKQPIDERIAQAEAKAAEVAKALEDERTARAAEKKAAEEAATSAQKEAGRMQYQSGFAEKFDAKDRAIAKFFEVPDLNAAAVAFATEEMQRLQKDAIAEHGAITDEITEQIETMLTHDAIAGKVKEILARKIEALKSDETLREALAPASGVKPAAAPKPGIVPAPKQNQAPALTNAMSAATSVSSSDLTPEQRRRLAIKRVSGG
jgi:hypothetical protein